MLGAVGRNRRLRCWRVRREPVAVIPRFLSDVGAQPCEVVTMTMIENLKVRIREAMKARRTVEKEILRVLLGELQTAEAAGRGGDAEAEKIARKLVKSNRETLDRATDPEQRATLEEEIAILETLLPKRLSIEEIIAALDPVKGAIEGAAGDGPATGIAMKHLKQTGAQVDGKDVAAAVKTLRS